MLLGHAVSEGVTLPGPNGVAWALELLAWAAAAAFLGEFVRRFTERWVAMWRSLGLIERLLLDFYLGGAAMYLLAALPIGAFVAPVVLAVPVAAALAVVARAIHRGRGGGRPDRTWAKRIGLSGPSAVAFASALALFAYELSIALPVATGNTFDASLLTTYVALLLQHGSIPLSFRPYAPLGLLYPQGTTVWLAWAQLDFGLPAARTSLLVTPLFLGLAPLGGFAFARRAFGTEIAGVAGAIFLASVASWTRVLVGGSNDFVFAFPLVLLLAGEAVRPSPAPEDRWTGALAFGLLVGYSAAMNPVGAQWLLLTFLVLAALGPFGSWREFAVRLGRWAITVGAALLPLAPTFYVLAQGWNSPGLTLGAAGPPAGTFPGINGAQFVGGIDPYLFRATDVWLSPVPTLRLELAILLTIGLGLLVVAGSRSGLARYLAPFRRFALVAAVVIVALLGVLWASSAGFGPAVRFADVSSAAELSIWLFTLYGFVAALPLVLALERAFAADRPPAPPRSVARPVRRSVLPRGAIAIGIAVIVIVPGAVLTTTALPPVLSELYTDFGNVSAGDFALFGYAAGHLPAGARVVIAPGSAAGFLPGYVANVVLLYPLVPGWQWSNASYRLVVSQLSNATLNGSGRDALASLDAGFLIVTGANTVLWPPFSPAPLLADPTAFPLWFQDGDAYLFQIDLG